jgi:TolA-binding protein
MTPPAEVTTGSPLNGAGDSLAAGQAAAPADTLYTTESGVPLGEALAMLDARMKTAPADSLPILQAEYRRLLEIAQRRRAHAAQKSGTGHDEYSDLNDGTGADGAIIVPSTGTKGLRPSELRASSGRSRRTAPKQAAKKPVTKRSTQQRTVARKPAVTDARRAEQSYVDGTAAARAGQYAEAAKDLEVAVKSPAIGARKQSATMAYALSLEKTGRLSEAADQYLTLSRSGGEAGHKAYVAYCRILGRLGQRERARRLVLQFLKEHPDSSQVVDARLLLQTL